MAASCKQLVPLQVWWLPGSHCPHSPQSWIELIFVIMKPLKTKKCLYLHRLVCVCVSVCMYVLCMYAFLQGFLLKAIIYNLMVSCESSLAVVMPGVCGT